MGHPPDLVTHLTRVADEYTQKAPDEVYRVFPDWKTELPSILLAQSEAQLRTAISGLESEVAKCSNTFSPYHFAKHALLAAIDVHAAWGRNGAAGAAAATVTIGLLAGAAARSVVADDEGVRPRKRPESETLVSQLLSEGWQMVCEPPRTSSPTSSTSSLATMDASKPQAHQQLTRPSPAKPRAIVLATPVLAMPVAPAPSPEKAAETRRAKVIREVLEAAPAAVRAAFPNFEAELHAMLSQPEEQLRTTVEKLSVAIADFEVRCFSDDADEATRMEAEAMAFGISAMRAVIHDDASLVNTARDRGHKTTAAMVPSVAAPPAAAGHKTTAAMVPSVAAPPAAAAAAAAAAAPAVLTARRVVVPSTPDFVFRSLGHPGTPTAHGAASALPSSLPSALDVFNPCCTTHTAVELSEISAPPSPLSLDAWAEQHIFGVREDVLLSRESSASASASASGSGRDDASSASYGSKASKATTVRGPANCPPTASFGGSGMHMHSGALPAPFPSKPGGLAAQQQMWSAGSLCGESLCGGDDLHSLCGDSVCDGAGDDPMEAW